MSTITKSKEAEQFYNMIDSGKEELDQEYDSFYDDGKKAAAMRARKALKGIMDACKQLRKAIQDDKVGRQKQPVKAAKKKTAAKKPTSQTKGYMGAVRKTGSTTKQKRGAKPTVKGKVRKPNK